MWTLFSSTFLFAQNRDANFPFKKQLQEDILDIPPVYSNIRTMAEWEEVQALTLSWKAYPSILKQITAIAREEVPVIILTDNPDNTESFLLSNNNGGPGFGNLDNIELIEVNTNTIWIRDYMANSVYADEVGSLFLVDWLYNRPRPNDDISPQSIADYLGLEMFGTTSPPYNLMNTGGNFMSDGFGTAFSSELVLDENDGVGSYNINYPTQSEEEIDAIHHDFMGIERYIKMPILPYDGIHHIDMHMKLLDEETLLVGEFPNNVSDGPQINANIEYVLSHFNSKWGTPYNVIRIPMPPSPSGTYPDAASYRTYTNGVFINNTIIIPTYREQYDTTAIRIWKEACPGYRIVGVDSDNTGANIISQGGAIHCITHTVGVSNPLLISHQSLRDTYDTENPYLASAYLNHSSGIHSAILFWRVSGEEEYHSVEMTSENGRDWLGNIPAQPALTKLEYYLEGVANDGKRQTRPMPAPNGYWSFEVLDVLTKVIENRQIMFSRVFPNPANAITCVEMNSLTSEVGELILTDITGRTVKRIYEGMFVSGISKYFLNASEISAGMYFLVFQTENGRDSLPLMIK